MPRPLIQQLVLMLSSAGKKICSCPAEDGKWFCGHQVSFPRDCIPDRGTVLVPAQASASTDIPLISWPFRNARPVDLAD